MLTLTDEAADLVRLLVSSDERSWGLRLGTDDDTHALVMGLWRASCRDDVEVARDGVRVWLSPLAATRLADRTLRAQLVPRPALFLD